MPRVGVPIAIVDAGIGNLRSVQKMFEKAGARAVVTADPQTVLAADKLVLPGVGHFGAAMRALEESGLGDALRETVLGRGTPILGICLGMQLFARSSEEGAAEGLGWVPGVVRRFDFPADLAMREKLKIPNIGWRAVRPTRESPLFCGPGERRFYFVHSYHLVADHQATILATGHYGQDFAAAIRHDNIWGVQFHPEKSHRFGLDLLGRFAALPPHDAA
jgi:glutamine amidotransferase